jgi:cation:H+ antiporter
MIAGLPRARRKRMATALGALVAGLLLLVWSADRFVDGSAAAARHVGVPPLLIGMLIVGFGTSAPEMLVSAMAALQNNPGIALGNAYGSNITNIALILGVAALIKPVAVHSQVLRKELPILAAVTALAAFQLRDDELSRADAWVLLAVFGALMAWSIRHGLRQRADALGSEIEQELEVHAMPLPRALLGVALGLVVLIVSSRLLVWGAIEIARALGVSDLIIGLTIVAVGTSLPEFASSVMAIRKGEDDIAVGNVIGSNLFNTLAVVGIAGSIRPMQVAPEILSRDVPVMTLLTVSLFLVGYGFRGGQRRINRLGGAALLTVYLAYTVILGLSASGSV